MTEHQTKPPEGWGGVSNAELAKRELEILKTLTAHDQFLADANKQWMADCERLTAELDAYQTAYGRADEVCDGLLIENAALRADAERWVWYATQIEAQDMDKLEAAFGELNRSHIKVTKSELDTAIDAAIAGEKHEYGRKIYT